MGKLFNVLNIHSAIYMFEGRIIMNKDTLEETKKLNKQSEVKKGSSDYLNSGMNSNANDATSKAKGQLDNEYATNGLSSDASSRANDATSRAKGQLDNEYATNGLSSNASNADMSNMTSNANDATSEETRKLNERSAANKDTNKR